MKTALKTVLTSKVHYSLFVLVCLGLAALCLGAKLIADDISAFADKGVQQSSLPVFGMGGG